MAQNFKISIHRTLDNLYIRLMGDFDGSSAWELINAIRENLNNFKFIQIDTSKLKKVYPFRREVFKSNLFLKPGATVYIRLKTTRPDYSCSGFCEGVHFVSLAEVKWCHEANGADAFPYGVSVKYFGAAY